MSTIYTGLTGKVTLGGEVAYISNWSVDLSREIIEVTVLGQKYKEKAAGQVSWNASADGTVCFGNDGRSGHKSLFDAMNNGTKVKCEFYLHDADKADRPYSDTVVGGTTQYKNSVKFEGVGFIESLSVDLSAEDKGNISISISGCEELAYPGLNPNAI